MIITGIVRGTPCDTGISYTFYGENICSVCQISAKYDSGSWSWKCQRYTDFPLYVTVKEFLHKYQAGIGRRSKKAKTFLRWLKNHYEKKFTKLMSFGIN